MIGGEASYGSAEVPLAVRRRAGPLRDHAGPEHRLGPGAAALPRGLPMSRADGDRFRPHRLIRRLARAALRRGLLPGDAHRRGRAARPAGVDPLRGARQASRTIPGTRSGPTCEELSGLLAAAGRAAGSRATRRSPGSGSGSSGASGCWGWWPLIGIPVGVGAAVFLEEYAPPGRLRRIIQTNIANLAGVPSIVYGILGLAALRPGLRRQGPGAGPVACWPGP